jgi:succinylglutamate desuccinylase
MEAVNYPRNEHGEIQAMIHPQLEFKDYQALYPDDPMLFTLDGKTIPYKGNSIVYPTFINEAASERKRYGNVFNPKASNHNLDNYCQKVYLDNKCMI